MTAQVLAEIDSRTDRRVGQSAPPVMLSLRDASFSVGPKEILSNISLSIRKGSFVCLIGPSGSGKTTLLRMLGGLAPATDGTVLFDGEALTAPTRRLAFVFQDYGRALLPWRTVRGNVELALEARGVPRADRAPIVDTLIRQVGLTHAAGSYPRQLSGGMQQRTQIARALAQDPEVLLMDEPFGALDAMTRQTLQDELLRLAAERGITTVFVTHDLEEAIYLGDEVIALSANPGSIADQVSISLPKPRHQLSSREDPQFLAHRHHLYSFLTSQHDE